MVKQATRQTFTYYSIDGSVQIVEDAPLAGHGRAWVLGSYKPPFYPSPLNVRVGDAGIKVWMIIEWLQLCGWDEEMLIQRYGHALTPDDVKAAKWYYGNNKESIDRRVAEELEPV